MQPAKRILCIDNNEDTCFMLSHLLRNQNFAVRTTCAVDEALELVRTRLFDLYVIDEWFPEVEGSNLCCTIREIDRDTPIIFYSGAAFESDTRKAFEDGAQGFVAKPHFDHLLRAIEHLMAQPASG
jgi:CheY-like chemotaxis protein